MYILVICGMFMFIYCGGTIVGNLFKNEISNEDFYKMLEEEKKRREESKKHYEQLRREGKLK